jgi:hypothetical protein
MNPWSGAPVSAAIRSVVTSGLRAVGRRSSKRALAAGELTGELDATHLQIGTFSPVSKTVSGR